VAEIESIAQNHLTFDDFVDSAKATLDGVFEWFKNFKEGSPVGDAMPAAPVFAIVGAITAMIGSHKRFREIRRQIVASPGYTQAIGEDLKIVKPTSGPAPEGEIKPVLKVTAKLGNVIEVKFTRGSFDGIELEMKIDNAVDWEDAGRFFKSPAVKAIPANGGLPRSVQVRGHYLIDDEPVGANSDTVTVVTTP
jgi:hypothetical protein